MLLWWYTVLRSTIHLSLNLQKLGWDWLDLGCFSSSLEWCCFLTKPFLPLEMWVDQNFLQISDTWHTRNNILLFDFCIDSFRLGPFLRHRAGADVQVLLPVAQSESHQLLSGRSVGGSDGLAHHWSHYGDLWVLPLIQVIWSFDIWSGHTLLVKVSVMWINFSFTLFNRGFFPVAVGFIRRVPVLGSLLSLPGISAVSISQSINCT